MLEERRSLAAGAAETVRFMMPTGAVDLTAQAEGVLWLDGRLVKRIGLGAPASLEDLGLGSHALELRYDDGEREAISVSVSAGRRTQGVFSYKPSTMIKIPGGSFTMGSPASEINRRSDEGPQHQVPLSNFTIGKYEVTFDEYDEYCAATGTSKPSDSGWGRGKRPVINVSWYDAVNYCNWRSKQEGLKPCFTISGTSVSCDFSAKGYRLPTEAEWEYAAKGGPAASGLAVNAVYAGSASLDDVAWHAGNSGRQTHQVGQKAANALGLYDMAGNVWEWCWDWYGSYASAVQTDPTGAPSGGYRVFRGGGWGNDASDARSSNRFNNSPGYRNYFLGFRLLRRP